MLSSTWTIQSEARVGDLPAETQLRLQGLTPREAEAALLAGRGLLVREIAEHLDVAQGTVKNLLKRARDKLGAANVRELSAILLRESVLSTADLIDPRTVNGDAGEEE